MSQQLDKQTETRPETQEAFSPAMASVSQRAQAPQVGEGVMATQALMGNAAIAAGGADLSKSQSTDPLQLQATFGNAAVASSAGVGGIANPPGGQNLFSPTVLSPTVGIEDARPTAIFPSTKSVDSVTSSATFHDPATQESSVIAPVAASTGALPSVTDGAGKVSATVPKAISISAPSAVSVGSPPDAIEGAAGKVAATVGTHAPSAKDTPSASLSPKQKPEEKDSDETPGEVQTKEDVDKSQKATVAGGGKDAEGTKHVEAKSEKSVTPASSSTSATGDKVPGPADQPPAPKLDTRSSEGLLQSLTTVPASSFAQGLDEARAASPRIQAREKTELKDSYPAVKRPTGLPRKSDRNKPPTSSLPQGTVPEMKGVSARKGQPAEPSHPVAVGPNPVSHVPTQVSEPADSGGGNWWDWLVDRVRSFLSGIPTSDPGLSTSAGPGQTVDVTGEADPNQLPEQQQVSNREVATRHLNADAATMSDFGENDIYPTVPNEILKPAYKPMPPLSTKGKLSGKAPALDPDTHAEFDENMNPQVSEKVNEQIEKHRQDQDTYKQESQKTREQGELQIAKQNAQVRADQVKLQQQAHKEVNTGRQQWREENAKIQETYAHKSESHRKEIAEQINTKVHTADTQADIELKNAEVKAKQKRAQAEAEVAAKKREESNRPKSAWARLKGAVSDAFAAIKNVVNAIFDAVRKVVKEIIETAKAVVRGIIEAARAAVVGLIKAFGAALKGFVTIALAAFPGAAAKARAWIDQKVDGAVEAVNEAAEALKKATDKILDWVGEGLDAALALAQKGFLLGLDALEFVATTALRAMEVLAEIVIWLRDHDLFLEGLAKLSDLASEIEAEARETLEALIDQVPAKVDEVVADAKKYFSEGFVKHVKGIWRHLKPALIHLKDNWWEEVKQMVWNLVWPFNEKSPLWKDVPIMVKLPGKIFDSLWHGETSQAIDQFLELQQKLNSLLGIFYGWFFIASVLIGAILGGIFGVGAGAIPGALAGAEFAVAVGEGLLIAMIATEVGVIVKAAYDLSAGTKDPEGAYARIANSSLTLAITGVMLILGEIAADLAKGIVEGVKGFFKGEGPEVSIKLETEGTGGEAAKGEGPEVKAEGEGLGTIDGEPVIAKEPAAPTADGHQHTIEITEDGAVHFCSNCGEMRGEYKAELADPANADLKAELDAADAMTEPQAKAKAEAEIQAKLEKARAKTKATETVKTWAEGFEKRSARGSGEAQKYQIRQCGPEETHVQGSGKEVWADGINAEEGLLKEAKHSGNPDRSPFVEDSAVPDFIREDIRAKLDDEFARYAEVVKDPSTPVTGLEIITNEPRAVPFFEKLLKAHGIPGRVVVRP